MVDPSLVIITLYLVCLINAWEQRRFLKIYINFTLFTPKLTPLGDHEIYNFLSPYPTDATYLWLRLALQFLQMLTHNARRTTTDANPQQQVTLVTQVTINYEPVNCQGNLSTVVLYRKNSFEVQMHKCLWTGLLFPPPPNLYFLLL